MIVWRRHQAAAVRCTHLTCQPAAARAGLLNSNGWQGWRPQELQGHKRCKSCRSACCTWRLQPWRVRGHTQRIVRAVWPPAFWPLRLPACDPARLHTRTRPRSFGTARPVAGFSFGAPPAAAAVSAFGAAAAGLGASMPAAAPATEAGAANAAACEAPELSAQLDGELAQCLRHMSKRDTTTKLKALQVCVKRQCAAHAAGHAHCCCTPAPFQPRSWGLPACVKHAAAAFV